MGYTLDYFVANLKCPVCGNITQADESTNMQTKLREHPELAHLGIGTPLLIDPAKMKESGYLTVRSPDMNEDIHILQTWECPFCGTTFNWAEIVVADNIIQDIITAALDRKILDRMHFISDDVIYKLMDITNKSYKDLQDADIAQVLRDYL